MTVPEPALQRTRRGRRNTPLLSPLSKRPCPVLSRQDGALDKKELYCVKYFTLLLSRVVGRGGSDERTGEEKAAGPPDNQRLNGIGDVGCSRGRRVVGVALVGAGLRSHCRHQQGHSRLAARCTIGPTMNTGHAGAPPGTKRELLVWIWYPSAAAQSVAMDDYVPAPMRAVAGPSGGLFRLLTRDLSKVHAHSDRDSDLSPQQRSYPVVIMRAGASADVWNYSTLAEDLASHGYVVVGFDAPYRTYAVVFPDGRVMKRRPENNPELCEGQEPARQASCVNRVLAAWTADIAFVLDRLERLNTSDASGKFTGGST